MKPGTPAGCVLYAPDIVKTILSAFSPRFLACFCRLKDEAPARDKIHTVNETTTSTLVLSGWVKLKAEQVPASAGFEAS